MQQSHHRRSGEGATRNPVRISPRAQRWPALVAGLAVLVASCSSIGPKGIARDRFDYGASIAESWKQQILLNIVKLRYLDVPVFMDVGQIVSGYTLETGVTISGQIAPKDRGDTFLGLGGQGTFTDRPTITYTPMTGDKFLRGLLIPIPTKVILHMLETGYPADFLLAWSIESLNGLQNRSISPGTMREADPEFVHALELMRAIQMAGGVAIGVERDKGEAETTVVVFRKERLPAATLAKSAALRRLLGVPAQETHFRIVTRPGRGRPGELAVQPRSLLQVMITLSSFIDVPPEHLQAQRAVPAPGIDTGLPSAFMARIHYSQERPADAYAAVQHRGVWFWVDDRDWHTKRVFILMMFLFTLADTHGGEQLPVLTIPTH